MICSPVKKGRWVGKFSLNRLRTWQACVDAWQESGETARACPIGDIARSLTGKRGDGGRNVASQL